MSKLFSSFILKNIELKNRIVMAPMCMYSANEDGLATDWHRIHYATRAIGGVGLIIQEATGVERRGRISSNDLGIWGDEHIKALKEIADSCKSYGTLMGIQIGHAGRKCEIIDEDMIAPSPIAFNDESKIPREMSKEDIKAVIKAFEDAAIRCLEIGYDFIEIHGAHGYLINQFLSPVTNKRTDEYGGSLENRARFLKEIIVAIRNVWPKEKPLGLRITAEDYVQGGNHPEDLAEMINLVKNEGLDIIDVSSGGVVAAPINLYQGYQVKFAEMIKDATGLPVMAGGLIVSPHMSEEILQDNRADMIFLGRELLRNPYWPLLADTELNDETSWPKQYLRSKLKR